MADNSVADAGFSFACQKADWNSAGLYEIRNSVTGKVYIGTTGILVKRFRDHRKKLRSGQHPNKRMLNDFKKHGENTFSMTPVLVADVRPSFDVESQRVEEVRQKYGAENVYNMPRESMMHVKHRMTNDSRYAVWKRLRNQRNEPYPAAWDEFLAFIADVGEKPKMRSRLVRFDNSKPHSKENSHWATDLGTLYISDKSYTINGRTLSVSGWAREYGVDIGTVFSRLKRNYSIQDALNPKNLKRPLAPGTVKAIREDHYSGVSRADLAEKYKLSKTALRGILLGHTYADIDGPIVTIKPPA